MPLPRTTNNRKQRAETRRLLAAIKVSIPGRGAVTIAEMFEPVSASDDDPRIRNELARALDRLAALLEPLPPADRTGVAAIIADLITNAGRGVRAQTNEPDSEVT